MLYLKDKITLLDNIYDSIGRNLEKCFLCPRECGINRLRGEKGKCGIGKDLLIYSAFLHKGEEPPLSGKEGSGIIFFSGCNLRCVYCQNYPFSHLMKGKIVTSHKLAEIILILQDKGAHNINLVTATPFLPLIVESLLVAFKKGFDLPIVYNTSGYESISTLEMLKGVIDIYLTDLKYINPHTAYKFSSAYDYPYIAKRAIKEMYQQRKNASFYKNIMKEGIIIRHLLLPGYIEESKKILLWLKENIPSGYISIMVQYHPYYKAYLYPEINRRIHKEEYTAICEFIEEIGIEKGWIQEFLPDSHLAGVYISPQIPF